MPRQRFRCSRCSFVGEVWYPAPVYDAHHNRVSAWPRCPECTFDEAFMTTHLLAPQLEPFPCQMQHDLLTGGTGLSVTGIDGAATTVSSLSEIRTIENESLRRARTQEGAPIVFRGFSQRRENMDRNTLAGSEFHTNRPVPFRRQTASGLPITPRVTTESEVGKG